MAGIDVEEEDGDTGPGAAEDSRTTPNARRRALQEFLQAAPTANLTHCKRCGPEVTKFVSTLMPFVRDFCSDVKVAADTHLWHVFYDGGRWEPSAAAQIDAAGSSKGGKGGPKRGARTTGLAQSRLPSDQPVGWHAVLFKCLLAMCQKQMEYLRGRVLLLDKKDAPFILIVCPLARVAIPLAFIVGKMWPAGEVSVRLHHSARGHDALIAHGIRHRRRVDGIPDQYKGVQADLAREYVTLTRGKLATVMWLEHEPHGVPGRRGYMRSSDQPFVNSAIAPYAEKRMEVLGERKWSGST